MSSTLEQLAAKFPAGIYTVSQFRDNTRIILNAENSKHYLYTILKTLKQEFSFDYLCDIGGVDYLHYPHAIDRYSVVYAVTNLTSGERLFVKAHANDPQPELPSVTTLWKGANWMEREVYDMFGIVFTGHPDLRRILMPAEFTSYPLRKDYPLRGFGERHNFQSLIRAES